MSSTADLPDLNVWLALIWPGHIHHQQAVHSWEQQAADQVLFCTVTALGLVRLVCQQPGVALAHPEHDGWEEFHQLLGDGELPVRLSTEAHRAALAIANG